MDGARIFRAADRPMLTDLYRAILDDLAGVHRLIPRGRMRCALNIPYLARENSDAEILALKKGLGARRRMTARWPAGGTTATVRRLGTWLLLFQRAILVVAANTPACLRVTLARRWR